MSARVPFFVAGLLEIVHVASAPLDVNFKVTGPGISRKMTLSPYSGPGSGAPAYLGLSGDAYRDDVRAGYGAAPVPEPGTAFLVAAGLLGLALGRSRVS